MMRGLTCFAVLVISAVGIRALGAQVPGGRVPPPPPPRKESLRHRLLRVSGIADNPSTLKGPEQVGSGQIWVVESGGMEAHGLTASGGYRSPVFTPLRKSVVALKGTDIVRLRVSDGATERLYTINGIIKLVGFSRDDPDKVLVLTEGASGRPHVGWLSMKTGRIAPTPYDTASSEDQRMLEHLRGWDRVYGGTSVYVNRLTKQSLSGPVEWTDVFLKEGSDNPINVSRCEGVDCAQPSLSADGRLIVFVKVERR